MPAAHGAVAPTAAIRPRLSYYIRRILARREETGM
jgi:hypothetical protein